MSYQLILFVMIIYFWISVDQFLKGNVPMGIVYFGYAFSNIGLAYITWRS